MPLAALLVKADTEYMPILCKGFANVKEAPLSASSIFLCGKGGQHEHRFAIVFDLAHRTLCGIIHEGMYCFRPGDMRDALLCIFAQYGGELGIGDKPGHGIAHGLRLGGTYTARLAVNNKLTRAARVRSSDHGFAGVHGLNGDQAVVFVQWRVRHGQGIGVEVRKFFIRHKTQKTDTRIAGGKILQMWQFRPGARYEQGDIPRHRAHGLNNQIYTFRLGETAGREEILLPGIGIFQDIRWVVQYLDGNTFWKVVLTFGDVFCNGEICGDLQRCECHAVKKVHHLPQQRAGMGKKA